MEKLILKKDVADFVEFFDEGEWNLYLKWMTLIGVRSIQERFSPIEDSKYSYKKGWFLSYGKAKYSGFEGLFQFHEDNFMLNEKKTVSFQKALEKNGLNKKDISSAWEEKFGEKEIEIPPTGKIIFSVLSVITFGLSLLFVIKGMGFSNEMFEKGDWNGLSVAFLSVVLSLANLFLLSSISFSYAIFRFPGEKFIKNIFRNILGVGITGFILAGILSFFVPAPKGVLFSYSAFFIFCITSLLKNYRK